MITPSVIHAAVITGGIFLIFVVLAVAGLCALREDRDRPILPWGERMRVEREKARTEVHQQHLEQQALEIKRLALDHRRTEMMKLINNDAHPDEVQQLALPTGKIQVPGPKEAQWE